MLILFYISIDYEQSHALPFTHSPCWIDTDSIFIAWKPRKNQNELVSIPQKYIYFAKDNLARIAQEASHVE